LNESPHLGNFYYLKGEDMRYFVSSLTGNRFRKDFPETRRPTGKVRDNRSLFFGIILARVRILLPNGRVLYTVDLPIDGILSKLSSWMPGQTPGFDVSTLGAILCSAASSVFCPQVDPGIRTVILIDSRRIKPFMLFSVIASLSRGLFGAELFGQSFRRILRILAYSDSI
jgi:hypothetical protein